MPLALTGYELSLFLHISAAVGVLADLLVLAAVYLMVTKPGL